MSIIGPAAADLPAGVDPDALLHALFEANLDGVLLVDDRGRIVGHNPAATTMLGYSADELLGRLAIPRLSSFDDVTNVLDFFLSERSDLVTGQVVYLGGVW